MRKTLINPSTENIPAAEPDYLDLEQLARVEISSECPGYPIESALAGDAETGWRAAGPGEQTIRLVFDQARTIKHIFLIFDEQEQSRTQEFVLRWRGDGEDFFRDILRQQYHFSPPSAGREIENYSVDLKQVKALELRIIPDINGGEARATLTRLRLSAR